MFSSVDERKEILYRNAEDGALLVDYTIMAEYDDEGICVREIMIDHTTGLGDPLMSGFMFPNVIDGDAFVIARKDLDRLDKMLSVQSDNEECEDVLDRLVALYGGTSDANEKIYWLCMDNDIEIDIIWRRMIGSVFSSRNDERDE